MSQNRAGYNKDSLASFSSRGPTFDGRRKPDVCGVGEYLYQALARYPANDPVHADMDSVRGTSFSTPLLAAHAVLVRQYFLLGYYPSGHATLTDQCTPSGALIKALFVHSTRPLQLVIYDDSDETVGRVEQTEYGDFLQGYGRVVLSDSLQFQQVTGALDPLSLYIIGCDPGNASKSSMGYRREDMIRTLTQIGETHTYEVVLRANDNSNGRPLKVTLAYTVRDTASSESNPTPLGHVPCSRICGSTCQ